MSFPPHLNRPLLPPPGIPHQYAGFPSGTPMIPVHMGIMAPAPAVMVPSVPVVSKPPVPKKDLSAMRAKDEESSGPTTTVFVGNISEKASDMLIRQLLAKCGIVLSWKRVQGASGKLQAFGFCEYKEPESTLRALRLLHDLQIGDKNLLVKVDAKTKAQLDEWKAKKKTANGQNKNEEDGGGDDVEVLDEETKKRDQVVKDAIDGLMREYAAELNAPSQDDDAQRRKRKKEKKEEDDINTIDIEEDKRDLISREISKFRDTHKKLEEEKDKREKERQEFERERREREKERERERERRDREREKERERERKREREQERERDRDKERDRKNREIERERDWERNRSRDRSAERSRSRELSRDRERERGERERERDKKRDQEDEEDAYERRKLERKLRDKEAAYQERLKNWELRERKKARDYAKESEREDERRREMVKEGKRLKEFLEDYDDDRDDPKYYRGSALQKRLRDREKEMEADERDRKREKEELEEIRQRLLDEGHPDPDAELRRMEEEEEERLRQPPIIQEPEPEEQRERHRGPRDHREHRQEPEKAKPSARPRPHPHPHQSDQEVEEGEEEDYDNDEDNVEAKPQLKPMMRPITAAPSVSSASGNVSPNTPGEESPCGIIIPHENSPPDALPQDENRPKIGLSLKLAGATGSPSQHNAVKRKKLPVDSVFNKFDDEEADEQPRKRKLVPLDYDDDKSLGVDGAGLSSIKGANTEEKRKHIKSLIEKIPTAKPELFSYSLDWSMVDTTLMERRVRPWINKKIIEYIGEEEPTLVDFVCSKVMAHSMPQSILDDVAMVLDEEAEVFIVKMWRLLIYETEAKKIGLVK
ncbi:RNA-binding protein 25b isoform X1 [Xiphophorus hellerii]|uniref:RNA-binding protein 25b isoform X1 n=1 Tax=Xiphophorus hellerii TaxID=8084 RepID=UPI0013B477E5|nr:RNA-binding protein 25-like isoform X1 [Xiphophorus hellerii]